MSTAPTQHHLDANGGRLYYEVRGSGPLLLVVGQPMTSAPFAALADDLAADHTVVTYDPHGVGESSVDDPSLPITPEIEADDLAAIVDELGLGPAAMMGTSGERSPDSPSPAGIPDKITTLIAHEPPVADLLPDAGPVRAAVDAIEDATGPPAPGSPGVRSPRSSCTRVRCRPTVCPRPPGRPRARRRRIADDQPSDAAPPEPSAKQQADDELFFLRMLKPFTRYAPDVDGLRGGSGPGPGRGGRRLPDPEVARRSAEALADRLGQSAVVFPSHHAGFMEDPAGFATAVREVLAAP